MRTLELALPPSPASIVPSFNYNSAARSVGNEVKTNFDVELFLRKPKHYKSEPVIVIQPEIQTQKVRPHCSTSDIIRLMDSLSLPGNEDLYCCLAKEATRENDRRGAYELQAHIMKSKVRPTTTFINRLLLMHVTCGRLDFARNMFDKMPNRDFHSWAIVFLGCIGTGDYEDAALLFVAMLKYQKNGAFNIPSWIMGRVLKACAMIRDLALGEQVHALCQKLGFINGKNSYLSGSLIRFYGEFRCLEEANHVLNQLSKSNTSVWAAKVTNDFRVGEFKEVFRDFVEMGKHGIKKNASVFSNVLKACTCVSDGGRSGTQVHGNAIKLGFESHCLIQGRVIELYMKYGKVNDAEKAFKSSKYETSVDCWNAMVAGYMQNGFYIEAMKLLYQMKGTDIRAQDILLNEGHFQI